MPNNKDGLVPLSTLPLDSWDKNIRMLFDAVVDVARRLNQNVVAVEHLLVVGAENGVEEMADVAPNLAAFREALLDALYAEREDFRRLSPEGAEQEVFLQPDLLAAFDRFLADESPPLVLEELMRNSDPRIATAVGAALKEGPEVVPPDTLTLEGETPWDASIDTSVATGSARERASGSGAPATTPSPAGKPRALPLTTDLCEDSVDDLPLVGRETLADQVARVLLRFHEPAVLIVGEPGTGKTAFVRGLASSACSNAIPALTGFRFFQLKSLDLVSQSHRGQDVEALVKQLLTAIEEEPAGVLVIDDLHMLVAKQGYPMIASVLDTVKTHIKKGKLRALLTVDSAEYERTFSNDTFFQSEITMKRLPPLESGPLREVLANYRPRMQKHFDLEIEDAAIEEAVKRSMAEKEPEYQPPGATLRLLDEACAMASARGEKAVTHDIVVQAYGDVAMPASMAQWDRERLANLKDALTHRIMGQDLAAEAVARRVRLSKLHLDRKPDRPDGVFLFIGPSGVGKTEMARGLARALYDDESRLVRLDMSEYMEAHSIARIIGSPPGYVGYGEEGALTGPINRIGHGVVLMDEIEKAHPQVLNLFLQVFDDGRLTDSKGRSIDFSDCVIIMTSNIGRELYAIHGEKAVGFGKEEKETSTGPLRDAVQEYLLRVLPSEFVNRIDELVPFRVLDDDDIRIIAGHLLEMEKERWTERGKALTWAPGVVDVVATSGYDPRLGARHLERNVERLVISLLSDAAVSTGFEDVKKVHLSTKDGQICLDLDGKSFQCLPHHGTVTAAPAPVKKKKAGGAGKTKRRS
jgi:ATP-dependent Clp protease ATP-binding subunit ClpC